MAQSFTETKVVKFEKPGASAGDLLDALRDSQPDAKVQVLIYLGGGVKQITIASEYGESR